MSTLDKYFFKINDITINVNNLYAKSECFNYNGFYIYPMIDDFFENAFISDNHFLKWLNQKHPFKCALIKMQPHTTYNWHKDIRRGVCINVLLEHTDSYTLFSDDIFDESNGLYGDITKMNYENNKLYLFNNQIPHAVYNFEGERTIFSIEFMEDKTDLCYENLLNEIKNEYT